MAHIRATMHTGRTRRDGVVYSAKHNDRNYDLKKSDNVDPERVHKNRYLIVDENGCASAPDGVTFDQHEHDMYQRLFGVSLEAQNDRYRKKGNHDRVKTIDDYRSSPRTSPEEIIMMIGTKDDAIPRSVLTRAMNIWLSEMQTRYGSNVHLLDIAVHADEPGGIHAHVRLCYSKTGKDGLEVSQRGALAELGIERPDPTKPESQYNNAKMAFTEQARALWLESIERSGGPDIIDVAKTPGKKTMTKEEYVAEKIRTEIVELHTEKQQLQQEVEILKREKTHLQTVLDDLKKVIQPLWRLAEKLSHLWCHDGRSALDHVANDLDELEHDEI